MSRADNANKEFSFSYKFDGSTWAGSVWASTREEAEMKLRAMANGTIDGIIMGEVPAEGRCPTCGRFMEAGDS